MVPITPYCIVTFNKSCVDRCDGIAAWSWNLNFFSISNYIFLAKKVERHHRMVVNTDIFGFRKGAIRA